MDWADFLSLETVEAFVDLAKGRVGHQDAAEAFAFLGAYQEVKGDPSKLSQILVVKRQAFIRRWARVETAWWEEAPDTVVSFCLDGAWPTRRHLAAIMYAWTPDDGRLLEWADERAARQVSWSVR